MQDCSVLSATQMECPSPCVNYEFLKSENEMHTYRKRRRRSIASKGNGDSQQLILRIGFIMDNVESVRDLEKHYKDLPSSFTYVEDPKYYRFPNEEKLYKGDTLVIEVNMFKLHMKFWFYLQTNLEDCCCEAE